MAESNFMSREKLGEFRKIVIQFDSKLLIDELDGKVILDRFSNLILQVSLIVKEQNKQIGLIIGNSYKSKITSCLINCTFKSQDIVSVTTSDPIK